MKTLKEMTGDSVVGQEDRQQRVWLGGSLGAVTDCGTTSQ